MAIDCSHLAGRSIKDLGDRTLGLGKMELADGKIDYRRFSPQTPRGQAEFIDGTRLVHCVARRIMPKPSRTNCGPDGAAAVQRWLCDGSATAPLGSGLSRPETPVDNTIH